MKVHQLHPSQPTQPLTGHEDGEAAFDDNRYHECETCGRGTTAKPKIRKGVPYYFCSEFQCGLGKIILN